MKKLISIIIVVALMLSACGSEDAANGLGSENQGEVQTVDEGGAKPEADDGTWAIYWYLCGSDLESGNGFATADLAEMMDVTLPENVKIVVQTGGAKKWHNEAISTDKIGRYEYSENGFNLIEEKKQSNMGDEKTLEDFLKFCNDNYPASHKMVVFWDHGGGSANGVSVDENFDGDRLLLPEIRTAFEATCEPSNNAQPYDIIGFDTCLMATVDVADIFKDIGKYMVASEEIEPALGWCYNEWLGALANNTDIAPDELGKIICDSYYSACDEVGLADGITLSVTDLSKIAPLTEAYGMLGDEALVGLFSDDSSAFAGEFGRAANNTENYGGNTRQSGFSDMADMGDFATRLGDVLPDSSNKVIEAINDAVVYQVKGTYKSHANGLSCFVNYSQDRDMLKAYSDAAATKSFVYYYSMLHTGDMDEAGYEYVGNLLNGGEVTEPEMFDINTLKDAKVEIKDNTAVLDIGAEAASQLAQVNLELSFISEDGSTMLYLGSMGSDDNIVSDWENGIFKENYRGMWGAIDGHLVYMDVVSSNEDYTIYQTPIMLNGEEEILNVAYDFSTKEYVILGVCSSTDEGFSSKDLRSLEVGDVITTLHFWYDTSNSEEGGIQEVDTFKVKKNTCFAEEELGDGSYLVEFEMYAPDGNRVTSELKAFEVKDGKFEYVE